jgi:hypothetical protein
VEVGAMARAWAQAMETDFEESIYRHAQQNLEESQTMIDLGLDPLGLLKESH